MTALDADAARRHLVRRGLLREEDSVDVIVLPGGVSSDVVAVTGPDTQYVVKRALPRLHVAEEWLADEQRIVAEARALREAGALRPGTVPTVIDLDEEARTLVLERAPASWKNWRDALISGEFDDSVPRTLGEALAHWQRMTAQHPPTDLRETRVFTQLRIDPFYRYVAARHPQVAGRINTAADELLATHECLVHGDLSPKNILYGGGELWLLDWEAAHVGDPCFDLAHLLTHLVIKAVHRPSDAGRYHRTAELFLHSYRDAGGSALGDQSALATNLGCLLLARVDGKSPAPYLRPAEQDAVRSLALRILTAPPADVLDTWREL